MVLSFRSSEDRNPMRDPESKVALCRISERNQWVAGWFCCGAVSLLAIAQVAMDWTHRTTIGKFAAASFILFLVAFPTALAIHFKRHTPITAGWVFSSGYIVLMLALQAFGPLAHIR